MKNSEFIDYIVADTLLDHVNIFKTQIKNSFTKFGRTYYDKTSSNPNHPEAKISNIQDEEIRILAVLALISIKGTWKSSEELVVKLYHAMFMYCDGIIGNKASREDHLIYYQLKD
jgi:hypothetical protein